MGRRIVISIINQEKSKNIIVKVRRIKKMARITRKYSFSKTELSNTDGKYILTEISKDDSTDYDLTTILDSFVGLSGVSISIGVDDEVPEIQE